MQIKHFTIALILVISGCIEPYYFSDRNNDSRPLVIYGLLTDKAGESFIEVSLSANPGSPSHNPVSGCDVLLVSDKGIEYQYIETFGGRYEKYFNEGDMDINSSYKIRVSVPDRGIYESEFSKFQASPSITDIYGERNDIAEYDGTDTIRGVQFYVDIEGTEEQGKYQRYQVIETWEDFSPFVIDAFYDGQLHIERDASLSHCYNTTAVNTIFTLSTEPLTENIYKGMKLQYVDNTTQRLKYKYTFLLRQLTISEEAYIFWESLKQNNQNSGGLYETQPINIKGNIRKVNGEEQVLGFFELASIKEKRYYTDENFGMHFNLSFECALVELAMGFTPFEEDYPQYLSIVNGQLWTAHKICYDCRLRGGTLEKPDFWIWE